MSETEDIVAKLRDLDLRTPDLEMAERGAGVPAASELSIEEINPANPHLFQQHRWHDHFARLRAEDPVHLNEIETAGRYWSITRYDDVRAIDGDWQRFTSEQGIALQNSTQGAGLALAEVRSAVQPFIAMDPPRHTEQRKTVRAVSAPSHLRELEATIRERTVAVLDELPEGETFDWVPTVSVELTTLMLATLFDFPLEDRHLLTYWSDVVNAVPQPGGLIETPQDKVGALLECVGYFETLFEKRREEPGFDLVSMLANGDATKDIPVIGQLGNLLVLIVGGNDTTRNTMSGSVWGLNQFPDQYAALRSDPGLVANLVPEILRWQTPLAYMARTVTEDLDFGGKQMLAGDQVMMWYLSANRDEDVFPDGDAIDLARPNADRHLSFGYGVHFCMGSRLAELQLRILWEELLARFARIEVQAEPERTFSYFTTGYTSLPVTVTRR